MRILESKFNLLQFIIARSHKPHYFVIEVDARPSVYGGILLLLVGEHVCLPVGESLALAYLLTEEVGIQLLQALVLNTDIAYYVLNVDKPSGWELGTSIKLHYVVVPREPHHWHHAIGE